jgi:hypothetical protein
MARLGDRPLPRAPLRPLGVAGIALAVALLGAWVAAPAPAGPPPALSLSPHAAELGEEESEEGEETEEELEFEADGSGGWAEIEAEGEEEGELVEILPPECLLRAAHPRAILDSTHRKLRLALSFKAWNTISVKATFRLKGPRGALRFGAKTRRPSRAGTLRLRRGLGAGAFRRARAARVVLVRLDVPETPRYCHLTMRLSPTRR